MTVTNENKDETNLLVRLARKLFVLRSAEASGESKEAAKKEVLDAVFAEGLSGHYKSICAEFGWTVDEGKRKELEDKTSKELEELEEKIKDAIENLGDSEVKDALTAKAEYICKIGAPKEERKLAFKVAEDKTVAIGHKLDLVFSQLIMSIFDGDFQVMKALIDKCKQLLEKGGDWERKNKLKVYESVYLMTTRSFKEAGERLLSSVATFTTTELFPYSTLVLYTVVCSITSLDRVTLKKKVVDSPEVLSVIGDMPHLEALLNSLYQCDYSAFFRALPGVADMIKRDMFLEAHHRYFLREIRKVVYSQFLESYKSVSLAAMATTFGVSSDFLDGEIARFVVSGDLNCKIDKVAGIVETIQPDTKNTLYQATIKRGDNLLNRVQKLGRVIDMD
ncbi:regulatory subunit N7 of 26S proteasome [Chloropicon primus]|nr:regulatory subunit N7 of 26S proteasome [Chloropicon primus]UPQ99319.1 regulatory subunit N7 of 26S proteasome [Chloropicon primus]|eukprot:QDZ20107.1 regulatory subunit N7 of 26S proteasome [Chloropicon primus]